MPALLEIFSHPVYLDPADPAQGHGDVLLSHGEAGKDSAAHRAIIHAMLDAQIEATERGNPASAQEELDLLASLLRDPERLQAALSGQMSPERMSLASYPQNGVGWCQLSWTAYHGPRGGKGWVNESGRIVYTGGAAPGSKRDERDRNAAKAHAVVNALSRYEDVTAAQLQTLADHLPALTVEQLRAAKSRLMVRAEGGAKSHADMVAALRKHVAAMMNPKVEEDLEESVAETKEGLKAAAEGSSPKTREEFQAMANELMASGVSDEEYSKKESEMLKQLPAYHRTKLEHEFIEPRPQEPKSPQKPFMGRDENGKSKPLTAEQEAKYKEDVRNHKEAQKRHQSAKDEWDSEYGNETHRSAVEAALKAGKPVPPEVLADYPDLAPKPASKPPEPVAATPATPQAIAATKTMGRGEMVKKLKGIRDQKPHSDLTPPTSQAKVSADGDATPQTPEKKPESAKMEPSTNGHKMGDAAREQSKEAHDFSETDLSKKAADASEATKIWGMGYKIRDAHALASQAHHEARAEHAVKSEKAGMTGEGQREALMAAEHNKAADLHEKAAKYYDKSKGANFTPQ